MKLSILWSLLLLSLGMLLAGCQGETHDPVEATVQVATAVSQRLTARPSVTLVPTYQPSTSRTPARSSTPTQTPTRTAAVPASRASATRPAGKTATQPAGPTATLPAGSTATPAVVRTALPPAPEVVVAAYLEAYPDEEAQMLATLTRARQSNLPAGGPARLLQVQGDLQGFAVQSGAEIPDPPQALVVVALRAGGKEELRSFNLLKEDGFWRIDSISK